MNYFAAAVVFLQLCATTQYIRQGLYWEAALWFLYGSSNIVLIILAYKKVSA